MGRENKRCVPLQGGIGRDHSPVVDYNHSREN